MTNMEAYLSDLEELKEIITALERLIPEGTTKRARQSKGEAARIASNARATIDCMKSDYIPIEPDGKGTGASAGDFKFDMTLLSRSSFPAQLDADEALCIVEVTVYRLNAIAVNTFLLDGPEPVLQHLGMSPDDTYITKHEIDDILTVVHIDREGAAA